MIRKVDLVMWAKNGAETLPLVLKRINEVIPEEFVNNRIIVDDNSTDSTRDIAKSLGWQVIFNEGSGISDGANTALRHVETEYFTSFEQDLILAKDWWIKVPSLLENPKVAVACGIRYSDYPPYLRALQEYTMQRYRMQGTQPGKTLDNTLYRTGVIKQIKGFPKLPVSGGVDSVLDCRLQRAGYEWKVNYSVISTHLRKGLLDELKRQHFYSKCWEIIRPEIPDFAPTQSLFGMIARLYYSPLASLRVVLAKKRPEIFFVYPLIRLAILSGVLSARLERVKVRKKSKRAALERFAN